MSIFPNCVKNVRVHALISDCVKFSRQVRQIILDILSCDLTTSKDQSYRGAAVYIIRNKIANERQVNNCDIRTDRDTCTFVIMYMYICPRVP